MRDIISRGKRLDNGEWVEGFYVRIYDSKGNVSHRIYSGYAESDCGEFYPDWFEVDPSTIGQFTGMCDKNGVRIFEGDIVRYKWDVECEFSHAVKFDGGEFCLEPVLPSENTWTIRINGENKKVSVIGNIHDNPELLEVEG